MTKNICECPMPPGGRAVCEADQLAICRIRDGQPHTECRDPPPSLAFRTSVTRKERLEYLNWALSEITGQTRLPNDPLDPLDLAILQSGVYADPVTGEDVNFRVPSFISLTNPGSAQGSSGSANSNTSSAGA